MEAKRAVSPPGRSHGDAPDFAEATHPEGATTRARSPPRDGSRAGEHLDP